MIPMEMAGYDTGCAGRDNNSVADDLEAFLFLLSFAFFSFFSAWSLAFT